MKSERDVKARVKEVLNRHGAWYFMPNMNGYGRAGVPDFIGCLRGRAFAIETKFAKNTLSAAQKREIDNLCIAGAAVLVVRDREDDFAVLEQLMKTL